MLFSPDFSLFAIIQQYLNDFLFIFLAPPLEELLMFNSASLTACLTPTDICSGSLYFSLTYSGAPGITLADPR